MTGRRFFNRREHDALYLAADGCCTDCGRPLKNGWHADHIHPYSRGGATDVANGQALCPRCDLRKGSSVSMAPHRWQTEARRTFFDLGEPKDMLVSATPGAGKTLFALWLAKEQVESGATTKVHVVVPTDALRQQWADAAAQVGVSLYPVAQIEDYDKNGYQGCVATYAQLARGAGSDAVRRLTGRQLVFAIIDEIHHAGKSAAWGDGLTSALEFARHRLALTGTPWRRDPNEPIPFVKYDPDGTVHVDARYGYGAAVADGVCRHLEFHAYDGEGRWIECGKVRQANLGESTDDDVSALLDTVYHPAGSWMPTLLKQADEALDELRTEVPDAGGLVIAASKWHARAYANQLHKITGVAPSIVISKDDKDADTNDPDPKRVLDKYRAGRAKWLVAVRMVSEGIDIPRLGVGVYASKIKTPLFFRQAAGRFVRTRPGEEFNARLFIPAVPIFTKHAHEIELELLHQLDLEREKDEKVRQESHDQQRTFELREPLSSSDATFDRAIFHDTAYQPEEIQRAEAHCRRHGIPLLYTVNVAGVLREEGHPVQRIVVEPVPPMEPRHRREKMLRREVESASRKKASREGVPYKDVNTDLMRRFGRRSEADVETLERMLAYLSESL